MATSNPAYETSRIFGILKVQKEQLEGNLTTSQYLETLDRYLDSALLSLLRNTRYLESTVASLVGWQEENFRRRVSLLSKREFTSKALTWLLYSKADKEKHIKGLRLDRGVSLIICHAFLAECKDYTNVTRKSVLTQEDMQVVHRIETAFLSPGGNLAHTLATVKYQSEKAADYRGAILSKYYRLAIMAAKRDYVNFFDCRIKLDDMCGDYLMATGRAIDKCDYEKGPLTTHIQNWFLTARSHCAKRYDRRDDALPENTSEEDYETSKTPDSLTVDTFEVDISREDTARSIRLLAKIADPQGDARKILEIAEILSVSEKKALGLDC